MKIIQKFKLWWQGRTLNEKLMYSLIAVLVIAIITRWGYVWEEVADGFSVYFGGRK